MRKSVGPKAHYLTGARPEPVAHYIQMECVAKPGTVSHDLIPRRSYDHGVPAMNKKTERGKKHHEHICPRCQSDDIEGGNFSTERDVCRQELFCADCFMEWTNYYKLKGWKEL